MSALVVNTNTQSIFAQRALRTNTAGLQKNIERLSTGFRINRAADDAAGLSIANKLTTSIRGLEKAKQNAGDGISLIQTAEGGLAIIQDNLQRIRELVIQGINGTNGANEKDALQREINERVKVIDDIAGSTKFNGISLLKGNTSDVVLQTGANNGETTTLIMIPGGSTTATAAATTANTGVDINTGLAVDTTSADTIADTTRGRITEGITTNQFAVDKLHLTGATVDSLNGVSNIAVTVGDIDKMIDNISRMRSYLGASQNALESKIEYMDIAMENASASRSRIQDVDIALESSALVKNQILQQTASTMLSQANQTPQIALQLLGR
jgi:flagellin